MLNIRTLIIKLNMEVRFLKTWGEAGGATKSSILGSPPTEIPKSVNFKTASSLRITVPLFPCFQSELLHIEKLLLISYRIKQCHITENQNTAQ